MPHPSGLSVGSFVSRLAGAQTAGQTIMALPGLRSHKNHGALQPRSERGQAQGGRGSVWSSNSKSLPTVSATLEKPLTAKFLQVI